MQIVTKNDKEFGIYWQVFITENHNVSYQYLPKWIEFEKYFSKNNFIEDLSFIIVNDNKPICICPLFLELHNDHYCFSWSDYGGYLFAPIIQIMPNSKFREKIEKECFKIIDELAIKHKVSKAMFMHDPLSKNYQYNFLMKYGYLDTSINTSFVDLTQSFEKLWPNVRRGLKSDINNGKKKFEIVINDYSNPDREMHDSYRQLHFKVAKRMTRPIETWDLQFSMLEDDNAVLVGLKYEGRFIAFLHFLHHNGKAYPGSTSNDPDYNGNVPISPILTWSGIEYYKRREFKVLELGRQHFGNQVFDHPTEKELSITFFLRGFSNDIISSYRGIKYYDKRLMNLELSDHFSKFLDRIELEQ